MPQFPLGSVLFPGQVLPLHIFEPRYRALAHDVVTFQVVDQPPEFGVVLIEKGFEVGGDDVRAKIGTVAQVMESEEYDDGRWGLVCVGTRRFTVTTWLEDDPYPIAEISMLHDAPAGDGIDASIGTVLERFGTISSLASQLGYQVGDIPERPEDPELASFQLSALAPLTQMDQFDLLSAPDPNTRLNLLNGMLDGVIEMLQFRLGTD